MSDKKTNKKHIFRGIIITFIVACVLSSALPTSCCAEDKGKDLIGYTRIPRIGQPAK
ncbi:MAG: hypothetical protein IJK71_09260 [Clostridia bacterium]|nr:hypothetical protein [Clostridia bacterium]